MDLAMPHDKRSIPKNQLYLYSLVINDWKWKYPLKLCFIKAWKNIMSLKIHLTKYVKDLYAENSKVLMRKIESYHCKWRVIPIPWIRRQCYYNVNFIKLIYHFIATPVTITATFL